MEINTASYVASYPSYHKCPVDGKIEYAFIGRSNVGKSSLINMLTNHSKLAKVSSAPGKTQYLNYFLINETWYLVDLPGYGYAKRSKSLRKTWGKMIMNYLDKRDYLINTFILIDANVKPQKIDLEFINELGELGIPFSIIFTKVDKSKPREIDDNIMAFNTALLETWHQLPVQFRSSAVKKDGKDEILDYIAKTNKMLENE